MSSADPGARDYGITDLPLSCRLLFLLMAIAIMGALGQGAAGSFAVSFLAGPRMELVEMAISEQC
jgi:hypothetical protein